ncbi:MAG: aspartate-semialdehyde dehydrogenase [Bryobacterales bacterium]|nr:aspartate-semialdehyde dehydrogenase [Bryobacteraceae bacterium]MDW8129276.1 aspartate-semialdehyde dehydrogenase [Bryobacterales bacterium]
MIPTRKIEVGILGATGMVGQSFVRFLQHHPWFEIKWLGASDRSAGRRYSEATAWRLSGEMPQAVRDIVVEECQPGNAPRLLFSAMDAAVATEIERAFAEAGHFVVSNSSNHRMEPDVPLLIPEVNPDHLGLAPVQRRNRGWRGLIVTNPNCTTVVLTMALAALRPFGIRRVLMTSMQAISGAGYPGVAGMDINANIIPFIRGEEEKVETEPLKILGRFTGQTVEPLEARISAHCNRVPVVDGHTETVSVELAAKPSIEELLAAFRSFRGLPQQRGLPSAPPQPLIYMEEQDRPQPRRDVERERGMTVFVGRLRPCPVLDWKFVALGHNTVRGAAGAAVLNAELMYSEGLLEP